MQRIADWMYKATGSTKMFLVAVGLLVAQSLYLAFTAIYPLPFDEYMHVGVTSIYARQWSPIITQQPPEASLFGDITRTGSFLYHYLMSFPYRVLDHFFDVQTAMVISLRLINIALVVAAMVMFYQLFKMWKIPRRIVHVAFLVFVFTPIVPFVAAHVNYDNLILLTTPIVLIFATRLIIVRGDVAWNGLLFAIFGLVGLLSKETFAPLLAVITLYVLWRLLREHDKHFWYGLAQSCLQNLRSLSFVVALVFAIGLGGLAVERYGGNVMKYGSFIVPCEKVQPREVCKDFGPWYRDNITNVNFRPTEPPYGNPFSFSQYWVSRMIRGYYAAFSHIPTHIINDHEPYGPIIARPLIPLPIWVGVVCLVGGLVALLLQLKRILAKKPYRFMLVVCTFYLAAVWAFNYQSYLKIWKAEAIQARYTYPILLLMFVLLIQSINWTIANRRAKSLLLLALVPLYFWGGGIAGWIIRSDNEWTWQNPTVQKVNDVVHEVLWHSTFH